VLIAFSTCCAAQIRTDDAPIGVGVEVIAISPAVLVEIDRVRFATAGFSATMVQVLLQSPEVGVSSVAFDICQATPVVATGRVKDGEII
tara:strand:- start:368 stop:634 length:267 start_codon:yes stop_codon:yes gene_type:complete